MLSKTITISMKEGMHTRPAAIFVREAGKFQSEIRLTSSEVTVNGKSIMGILMLALGEGAEVIITAEGPDEENALDSLSEILGGAV
ncbi:MAG: HPr family phosphocarrier protein [Spirochaetia bacterium]|nr:HPr family phosphocarrier protein [Spirochaetia bacterium]